MTKMAPASIPRFFSLAPLLDRVQPRPAEAASAWTSSRTLLAAWGESLELHCDTCEWTFEERDARRPAPLAPKPRCSGSSSSAGSRSRLPATLAPALELQLLLSSRRWRVCGGMRPAWRAWPLERGCGATSMSHGQHLQMPAVLQSCPPRTQAGTKPHRTKSEEPEEAIVIGVHFKGEEDIACPSQLEVQLEFLRHGKTTKRLDRARDCSWSRNSHRSGRKTCVPAHWVVSTEEDAEVAAALREAPCALCLCKLMRTRVRDRSAFTRRTRASGTPFTRLPRCARHGLGSDGRACAGIATQSRQVCRLTSCQRRALSQVRAHATASHEDPSRATS